MVKDLGIKAPGTEPNPLPKNRGQTTGCKCKR